MPPDRLRAVQPFWLRYAAHRHQDGLLGMSRLPLVGLADVEEELRS
jgi:hypothetical protein